MRKKKRLILGLSALLVVLGALVMKAQVDSKAVGSNQRFINIVGDANNSANLARVLATGNGLALAAQYALITKGIPTLINSGGTYDEQISAAGTTGVPVFNWEGTKASYRAAATALATVSGATDVFQVCGSGTKTVRVTRILVAGTIATAAQYVDVTVVKRSTADTGGTSSAPSLVPLDANDAAATAALLQFTANPTLGTGVGTIDAYRYFGALTGTAALMPHPAEFTFGNRPGARSLVLRGAAQCASVNLNAPGNAGTFDISAEFTEE